MKVSVVREDSNEVVEFEIHTDLEFNPTMLDIVEMAEKGLIYEGQMWNMLTDEIYTAYGLDEALRFYEGNVS